MEIRIDSLFKNLKLPLDEVCFSDKLFFGCLNVRSNKTQKRNFKLFARLSIIREKSLKKMGIYLSFWLLLQEFHSLLLLAAGDKAGFIVRE